MKKQSEEFVVVIGRFTPIGGPKNHRNGSEKIERIGGCELRIDGTPLCQKVKLERIVKQ